MFNESYIKDIYLYNKEKATNFQMRLCGSLETSTLLFQKFVAFSYI